MSPFKMHELLLLHFSLLSSYTLMVLPVPESIIYQPLSSLSQTLPSLLLLCHHSSYCAITPLTLPSLSSYSAITPLTLPSLLLLCHHSSYSAITLLTLPSLLLLCHHSLTVPSLLLLCHHPSYSVITLNLSLLLQTCCICHHFVKFCPYSTQCCHHLATIPLDFAIA